MAGIGTPSQSSSSGGIQAVSGSVTASQGSPPWQVVGNIASAIADSGNPVKVGGVYHSATQSFADGQRADLQVDSHGYIITTLGTSLVAEDSTNNAFRMEGAGAANSATVGNPVLIAGFDGANTIIPVIYAPGDGNSNDNALEVMSRGQILNGSSTWDRIRSIVNATNSTGTGIQAVGNLAQFDDVSPTSITENQFGNLRMSANRNLYQTIRDAAGNERGVNVTATNQMTVIDTNLPTSAALADATVNPTTSLVGANAEIFNGTTWDRMRTANSMKGTPGTGLLGTGILAYDGANWQSPSIYNPGDTDSNDLALEVMSRNQVWNGSSWTRIKGDVTSGMYVQIKNGLMPTGTALNTYSAHITTNTTTTPTASLAYISSITISIDVIATTAGTLTIRDKSGTPLILVNGLNTTTAVSTIPTVLNFQTPIKMTGGIDIITSASVGQATLDIWINYYQ